MEISSYASDIDICTAEMDSSFGRYWNTSFCIDINNTCKETGSYCRETVLYFAEISVVSSELEYHTMEMVIIIVLFVFQIARLMNRMSARLLKTVEVYSQDDEHAIHILMLRMLIIFPPRREWPDRILMKKAAQSQAPQSDEIIKSLLQVHHIHMDILASMCWSGILQAQPSVLFVALETHNH